MRETGDEIEKIGVQKSRRAIDDASVVVLVLDASAPLCAEDREAYAYAKAQGAAIVLALNKTDLPRVLTREAVTAEFPAPCVEIAARRGQGVDALLEEVYRAAVGDATLTEGVVITNSRHAYALMQAEHALSDGIAALEAGIDLDCASIDLHDAWRYLGEITGQTLSEQIIDRIFEKFCLGK